MQHYLNGGMCPCGLGGLSVVIGPDFRLYALDVDAPNECGAVVSGGFPSATEARAWARRHRMVVAS